VRAPIKSSSCTDSLTSCAEASGDNIKTAMCCCTSDLCNNALALHKQSRVIYFTLGVLTIMTVFRFF